jgi:hypothetical protein
MQVHSCSVFLFLPLGNSTRPTYRPTNHSLHITRRAAGARAHLGPDDDWAPSLPAPPPRAAAYRKPPPAAKRGGRGGRAAAGGGRKRGRGGDDDDDFGSDSEAERFFEYSSEPEPTPEPGSDDSGSPITKRARGGGGGGFGGGGGGTARRALAGVLRGVLADVIKWQKNDVNVVWKAFRNIFKDQVGPAGLPATRVIDW